jgi:biotin transport system substrate-specific component
MSAPIVLRQPALTWTAPRWLGEIAAVTMISLSLAVLAQLCIELPGYPVRLTGTTFGVLLTAALCGPRRAVIGAALYLMEGALGAPFFSSLSMGWSHLLGPAGGYLFGFLLQAWIAGHWIQKKILSSWWGTVLGLSIATAVQWSVGILWLSLYVGGERSLLLGTLPFLPGDLLKVAVVASLVCFSRKRLD